MADKGTNERARLGRRTDPELSAKRDVRAL
jgi:hypothetical protein